MKRLISIYTLLLCVLTTSAQQQFFNLSADELRVDSVIPHIGWSMALPEAYADSIYSATLLYPEYIDMAPSDVEKYFALSSEPLPEEPAVETFIGRDRRQPRLLVDVCPLVCREGKYQFLVSYMLKIESHPQVGPRKASAKNDFYAEHSVLSSGRWAKIRVPATGVYQLTDALIRKAGFTDLSRVKIYGYGGNLQNEKLLAAELLATDDLQEVEQCVVGGRHFFFAKGPVSWVSKSTVTRTRNPYSDYGYYFITQTDDAPLTLSEEEFRSKTYPAADDYHELLEEDGFAWYAGGRNLYSPTPINVGQSQTYHIPNTSGCDAAQIYVNVTASATSTVQVEVDGQLRGTINVTNTPSPVNYNVAKAEGKTFNIAGVGSDIQVRIVPKTGGPVRLDYISATFTDPKPFANLSSASIPAPEYVYNITNQDRHADPLADMVIIIPTSQRLLNQAQRLKAFHEEKDGMRVNIVPADELYNEFSSGTPDANAYRRYLKMLYDRAETEAEQPKYLLLMGDCVWDNRMLTPTSRSLSPDNYLLCYESENSMNKVYCYVDDGWFGLLDEGEGTNPRSSDLLDVAVGRFPVTTDAEAKIMVDKTIAYAENANVGPWQNTIMFMGDDGNDNIHMKAADDFANMVEERYPGYIVKKVMWDMYKRETNATGNTYPDATKIIKQQQQAGALIMDYAGHGREDQVSHESVLRISDFAGFTNQNLPLWITASCDIMPFDGYEETIGETAVLNSKGGAVAFLGTTRTVYADRNERINMVYLRYVLGKDEQGRPMTIGEALRRTKNYLITTNITSEQDRTENKLQYSLLGDPALALLQPKSRVVVDCINGSPVGQNPLPEMKAGSIMTVEGHVESDEPMDGTIFMTVRDTEELKVCRGNANTEKDAKLFTFRDRSKTLFSGSDNISGGRFSITFPVPKDINYADDRGMITLFAYDNAHTETANGASTDFIVGGTESLDNDERGPSIYCYLNTPAFANGGTVNTTPYFYAELNDPDGLNTSGNGVGHDLQLVVDGKMTRTYVLNDNFTYDFGSYTSGAVGFSIPQLEPGAHTLQFRAWDIFNNSSTATLDFNVVPALEPQLFSVSCTKNPATTSTQFVIAQDRTDSDLTVTLDILDMSGRILWRHTEHGSTPDGNYIIDWDLTVDDGHSLQTGVYLYRASISAEGSEFVSKARKLIIIK